MSSAAVERQAPEAPLFSHDGLLYRTESDYLAGVLPFLASALAGHQQVFVAVPDPNLELLRPHLDDGSARVELADMTRIGRNPARILPLIARFVDAHSGERVRVVSEPIWPGRSEPEICEAARHEAMLNTAFADAAVDILCPYDVGRLAPAAIASLWRTHPEVVEGKIRRASPDYSDPRLLWAADDIIAPVPPRDARMMSVSADALSDVRPFVGRLATEFGLGPRRIHDLVLAVYEIATNTVLYTTGTGTLRIWPEPATVVCELQDGGFIADVFAGRRRPSDTADHGRGLWMANQLCDLVQLRSTTRGTTIRLHMDCDPRRS